jgi:hypothetical protein
MRGHVVSSTFFEGAQAIQQVLGAFHKVLNFGR